jgi:hypothetical protein
MAVCVVALVDGGLERKSGQAEDWAVTCWPEQRSVGGEPCEKENVVFIDSCVM